MKKILFVVLVVFVLIQFIRPARNLSDDNTYDISTGYSMPAEVSDLMQRACYNCHSNKTEYPWYSNVQPVGWWINSHVSEGKRHMNYSNFASGPVANQNRRLEETVNQVETKDMPIPSYTWFGMHKNARLTEEQRDLIINWAREQMDLIKASYPADSLVVKRRIRPQPAG